VKRTVVFVPDGEDQVRQTRSCVRFCEDRGYQLAAVTATPAGAREALASGRVDRVVVAAEHHLRLLLPGVEVVTDGLRQRRCARVNRGGRS
jgi:hypothetical protein